MERTGNIRGWNYEGIRGTASIQIRIKVLLRDPELIPLFFYAAWIEAFI
jgi:hypothetical protein